MSTEKPWIYSPDENEGWGAYGEEYTTREEAVAAAILDSEVVPGGEFWTGRQIEPELPVIDGAQVCESIGESMLEELGEETVGDWLDQDNVAKNSAAVEILGNSLTKVFHDWLKENKLMPDFFLVDDEQKHTKPL